MRGWGVWGALIAGLALSLATGRTQTAKQVIVISWDGAPDWVVDRLLEEGKLPNVARLAKMGARAEYCIPAFPSKTACGHAAIWTGCYGDINGITGNSVPLFPRREHSLLETRSGFDSRSLHAEPLWITAAKAGKRVVILSATQSFPADPHVETLKAANVPEENFVSFSGFESPIQDGRSWTERDLKGGKTWEMTVGDQTFTATLEDDPGDPKSGFDTVVVRLKNDPDGGKPARLKPGNDLSLWSPPFRVTRGALFGNAYFRLFELAPDGSRLLLYQRAVNGLRGAASPEETAQYLEAYGGFHDDPFRRYEDGAFGAPLWEGGDGTAEKRALELVRQDCEFLKRSVRYALKRWNPELLFHYTPMSDSAGHTWMGILDPDSPPHQPELAAKIWPYYEQVLQLQDAWLGDVLDQVGPETAVCLVSDHGMAGISKNVAPNRILEQAGLLAQKDGKIDLSKTQICAPPWADFFLSVNGTDWNLGIVPPEQREEVLRKATEALLNAVDPQTKQRTITRVFRPEEVVGMGLGGVAGGDLYFDLAPGYYPSNSLRQDAVRTVSGSIGQGVHGFFPYRAKMQAICYLGGAGIQPGILLSGIRQIDIAPTLARLMGIPIPRNAQGHILGEALK